MIEHDVGAAVVLTGTVVEIQGDIALVRVDRSFPAGGTVTVRLGRPPGGDDDPAPEEMIAEAVRLAKENPGQVITARRA